MTDGRLVSPQPHGLPVEPSVQFCDFCGDVVYRTLLVRVGDGSTVRGTAGESQIKRALTYKKACPGCAEGFRRALVRAELVEEMGKMLAELASAGATQSELDEYIEGWGLDRELVKGFGVPEVDQGVFR